MMKIATIQQNIFWEDTEKNINHLEELLRDIEDDVELIVLPEMFTTGFSMNPVKVAVPDGGAGLEWMKRMAALKQASMVGSIAVSVDGKYYNRLYWVFPNGEVKTYDKRHLFRMADEHQVYQSGSKKLIVEWKGVRFCPLVCYDLRFPVWSRRTKKEDYDCLLYVANWPAVRSEAWYSLLKARAIENLSYVIGVNRVGVDGNDIAYDGKSAVFDFKGLAMDQHELGLEGISIQSMDLNALQDFRTKFPADLDADDFEIL
jgi:predicted amidohydrolase